MARRKREFWEKLVAEVECGELEQKQIAARHGVSLSTLQQWLYRLRREREPGGDVQLLPVRVAADDDARRWVAEIQRGDVCVRVRDGVDSRWVAELAKALAEC